jgi:hypothetical protein
LARQEKEMERKAVEETKRLATEKRKAENAQISARKKAAKCNAGPLAAAPLVSAQGDRDGIPTAFLKGKPDTAIKEFASMDELTAKVKSGEFDYMKSEPFIVRQCSALQELCDERGTKASLGIYGIQLPTGAAKQTGRSQAPFASDRKVRASELLLESVPVKHTMTSEPAWANRLVQTCSVFGCLSWFKSCDIERNGIGNIRYQVNGKREFALVDYKDGRHSLHVCPCNRHSNLISRRL